MMTFRLIPSAVALVALGSVSQIAEAQYEGCVVVYDDHAINFVEREIVAWALIEDYFDDACAGYYPGYFAHSYEANISITSPSQNVVSGFDGTYDVPMGGGIAYAYTTMSYDGEPPGDWDIETLLELFCSIIGLFISEDDNVQIHFPTPLLFEISRHTSTSLTESEVDDTIFPAASYVVWHNDGGGDVTCPVLFLRNFPIATFTEGNGIIDSESDRDQVIALPGLVKIVSDINYCKGPTGQGVTTLGCSSGAGMIVVRTTPSLEGILWAHEYGHNQYLWLVQHGSDPYFLSYGTLMSTATRVTSSECGAYQNPL